MSNTDLMNLTIEELKDLNTRIQEILKLKNQSVTNEQSSDCLYGFLYNSCIHDSSYATISIHYSKEGAEKSMQEHKQKEWEEFNEMYVEYDDLKFGEHEDWRVEPVEVLP